MTAVYSIRIIYFVLISKPRFPSSIIINENNPIVINPIKRLALGSILAGFFISYNIPPTTVQVITMPLYIKITALVITIAGFAIALDLNKITNNLKPTKPSLTNSFSTSLGYFPTIMHRLLPLKILHTSIKTALTILDLI